MTLSKWLGFLSFAAAVAIVPGTLDAAVTGSILGVVTDSTQGVIPAAQVVATNLETNQRQETATDTSGQYRLLALPTGRYRVESTAPGFQKYVSPEVVVTVDEQRRIDIVLQVGAVEQTVEVTASQIQIETTNTQLGEVIDEKKVLFLPLNGRSYIDLLGLQAGVAPTTSGSMQQDRPVSGGLSAGNISVNGQRETANAFLVNGGDVSEGRNLGASVIPNLDSVAEFRLITNSFDAEYGRFSGAVMNAVTKSGTNRIHGSVFEFLRNDKLDARNFFDPERGDLKRNQFGYAVGGPAIRDKLFWFTDYQGTREVRGIGTGLVRASHCGAAPGQLWRCGSLSRRRRKPVPGEGSRLCRGPVAAAWVHCDFRRALRHSGLRQHRGLRVSRGRDTRRRYFRSRQGNDVVYSAAEHGRPVLRQRRPEPQDRRHQARTESRFSAPAHRQLVCLLHL